MILAKTDGTTLEEHLQDCLLINKELCKAIPELPNVSNLGDFGMLQTIAVLFHDFGKIHPEFQKVLRKEKNKWSNQRHEVYSVCYSNKLDIDSGKLELIQKVILAHHKSFGELKKRHKKKGELAFEKTMKDDDCRYHPEDITENLRRIPKEDISSLMEFVLQKLKEYGLNIPLKGIIYQNLTHPVEQFACNHFRFDTDSIEYLQHLLMLGALKMCDHYGSAKISYLPSLERKHFSFLKEVKSPYQHQKESWETNENVLLIAPTGSGKTESAIGWVYRQAEASGGRVFYILPYTASINAMHKRLCKCMEGLENPENAQVIGLQHGNLQHYLYSLLNHQAEGYEIIKERLNLYKKLIYPLQIVTPFQILKHFFGVKGFEIGFINLVGAKLIFDEIHAYDTVTFAQIVVMLNFLVKRMKCRIFIMTATLPTFMLEELRRTLGRNITIKAEEMLLKSMKRHIINVYDGDVNNAIDELNHLFIEKRVIIVCNTVKKAQECYRLIKDRYPESPSCLLHGRFNGFDRMDKEKDAFNNNTRFLIGTQAIEVSLDLDYDFMITEGAPLDALLQRFGRVNRKIEKEPCNIFVCSVSSGVNNIIYSKEKSAKTLEVLKRVHLLDESMIQDMLDEVYPCWTDKELKEFQDTKILFKASLSNLQPYQEHKENEEDFYKMFTNIKVLPAMFYNEYISRYTSGDIIGAESLMVGLHQSTYRWLRKDERISIERFAYLKDDKAVTESVLVAKCKYNSEIGLNTDEYEEIENTNCIL